MKTEKVNPETVIVALKARLKKRAHANLDNVHAVCRAIHEHPVGRKDYSIATVARKLEQQKQSPSYNTLSAPGGAHFKELILAWAQWDGVDMAKPVVSSVPSGAYEELLRKISDPAVRSEIGFLLAEGRRNRMQLDAIKGIKTLTIDIRPKDGLPLARSNPEALPLAIKPALLESELDALKNALDEKHLHRCGLVVGPDGEISLRKLVVFHVGFMTGLRKLIGTLP